MPAVMAARWALAVMPVAGAQTPQDPARTTVRSPDRALVAVAAREQRGPSGILDHSAPASRIVDWSRLGFILADAPKLERNFSIGAVAQRSFDDTWEQPWGERRYVRNHGNEMRVTLSEKSGRALVVVFRVFDDGVGFRYEFPDQAALKQVNIVDELTEFAIAEPATAWWIPGGEWNRYEYLYNRTPLDGSLAGAHAAHDETRERRAPRHPRSGAGGLRGHVAAAGRGAAAQGRAVAVFERTQGHAHRAVRDALAHAADRGRRARTVHVRPHPQSQRA